MKKSARGFSLIELAIVLVIAALVIGSMMIPLSTQSDLRRVTEGNRMLSDATDALIGFALTHSAADGKPYLPCPDTDNDGRENRAGSACANQEGRLPWADLGIGNEDPWGNRLRYRVAPAFAANDFGFTLSTPAATLRVCSAAACGAGTLLSTALPAVIVSQGANGAGAFNAQGGVNAASANANEIENSDGDNDFVQTTDAGFDDLVAGLSPNILFNRMVAAGRLP